MEEEETTQTYQVEIPNKRPATAFISTASPLPAAALLRAAAPLSAATPLSAASSLPAASPLPASSSLPTAAPLSAAASPSLSKSDWSFLQQSWTNTVKNICKETNEVFGMNGGMVYEMDYNHACALPPMEENALVLIKGDTLACCLIAMCERGALASPPTNICLSHVPLINVSNQKDLLRLLDTMYELFKEVFLKASLQVDWTTLDPVLPSFSYVGCPRTPCVQDQTNVFPPTYVTLCKRRTGFVNVWYTVKTESAPLALQMEKIHSTCMSFFPHDTYSKRIHVLPWTKSSVVEPHDLFFHFCGIEESGVSFEWMKPIRCVYKHLFIVMKNTTQMSLQQQYALSAGGTKKQFSAYVKLHLVRNYPSTDTVHTLVLNSSNKIEQEDEVSLTILFATLVRKAIPPMVLYSGTGDPILYPHAADYFYDDQVKTSSCVEIKQLIVNKSFAAPLDQLKAYVGKRKPPPHMIVIIAVPRGVENVDVSQFSHVIRVVAILYKFLDDDDTTRDVNTQLNILIKPRLERIRANFLKEGAALPPLPP
jgi:hypothetical protein